MTKASRLFLASTLALLLTSSVPALAQFGPKLYIAPQGGFETYLAAAITKKQVPVTMTNDPATAAFILKSVEEAHPETTGSKIARCLFAYCAGMEGTSTAGVQLIDVKTQSVVWAYQVRKAGANNHQSKAEAVAKHLKNWMGSGHLMAE